jgi:hypothetical protein
MKMKIVPRIERPENNQKVPPDPRALLRFTNVFVMTKAVDENEKVISVFF